MEVQGSGPIRPSNPIQSSRPAPQQETASTAKSMSPQDEIEISDAGRMLDDLSRSSDVRAERLAQIKAAIDNGTYDTPAKLEAALEKMIGQISQEHPSTGTGE